LAALALLNSTTCAHLSALFGMTGEMAVHAPGSDAGAQAVIEAAFAIAEDSADLCLAGGVAPSHSPFHLLHLESLGWPGGGRALAEGAGMLVLMGQDDGGPLDGRQRVRLSGIGRAFAETMDQAVIAVAMDQAMTAAMTMAGQTTVDLILSDDAPSNADGVCRYGPVSRICAEIGGHLGPANPVVWAALAAHCLRSDQIFPGSPTQLRSVMICTCGPQGQVACLLLAQEAR
jgi:hypothetical protein